MAYGIFVGMVVYRSISFKGLFRVLVEAGELSAVVLMIKSGLTWDNLLVMAVTAALLFTKWIPAPVIVLLVLVAGFVF